MPGGCWVGSEGGTAESSPQSGAAGHLDIEDGDSVRSNTISTISTQYQHNIYTISTQVTSDTDDDDTELVRHKHNFVALEQDTAATPQVTIYSSNKSHQMSL